VPRKSRQIIVHYHFAPLTKRTGAKNKRGAREDEEQPSVGIGKKALSLAGKSHRMQVIEDVVAAGACTEGSTCSEKQQQQQPFHMVVFSYVLLYAVFLGTAGLCWFSWHNRAKAIEAARKLAAADSKADGSADGRAPQPSKQSNEDLVIETHAAALFLKQDLERKNDDIRKKKEAEIEGRNFIARIVNYLLEQNSIFVVIFDFFSILLYPALLASRIVYPPLLTGYKTLAFFNKLPVPFIKVGDILQILYCANLVVLFWKFSCLLYEVLVFIHLEPLASFVKNFVTFTIASSISLLYVVFTSLAKYYRGACGHGQLDAKRIFIFTHSYTPPKHIHTLTHTHTQN